MIAELIEWIRDNLCPDLPPIGKQAKGPLPTWNHRRVLIFTEFTETKTYLRQQFETAFATMLSGQSGKIILDWAA